MRGSAVGRNYARALFELGERHGEVEDYAEAFASLNEALEGEPRIREFLETPAVDTAERVEVLRKALDGRVPERFVRFVLVVLNKNRHRMLPIIRQEYDTILDEQADRVHADITLAREPDEATVRDITERLTTMLGRTVVPHVHVNPALVGGILVKYGDRVMDGSVRRQLVSLKREMMRAGLPRAATGGV